MANNKKIKEQQRLRDERRRKKVVKSYTELEAIMRHRGWSEERIEEQMVIIKTRRNRRT